ncbi:serine/threonine-protein kinase [Rhodopirellula sp. MGV]|uniref:serine/threonine-protein kinase n=1 Tax=Rhodopirellula sp. MGV TaxID=2023130 RepID=UPI000B96C804|nr:serine/threonine-protein kinase [Rhodopirellula sp. MGV]OYP31047.1 protein kinase [Rhodopirellula sp. MGV]PNY34606.1 protein kinase [Rhodopirellula baltica]
MSSPQDADDPIDEAFAAYLRSVDEGSVGTRDEFLAKFPSMAQELKSLMEAADAIDRFAISQSGASAPEPIPPSAETVDSRISDADQSGGDPAETLPEADREKGDPGPTLPYDLGEYELQKIVGRGGMGVVYQAQQKNLNRTVAVKMIRGGMLACENDVRRFYTEAQAAAGLHHPGIVPVYQFGHQAGHHFFSMALIEGTDLQKKINEEEELSIESAARYVRDVARAIEHAHQNDVLHRDLKPANILVDQKDRIHITDFGLAKNLGTDSSVTGSGAAVGTPNYMAPEQAGGHSDRATKQSDIYSLGAILFACITGRPPLVGDSIVDTLMQVVHEPAPPMRTHRAGVPHDLETIVAKCLEKSPKKRYHSAGALAEDLDAFLEGRPILARPRGRLLQLWHWFSGVPLVGALIGRKVVRSSPGHRRFQAAMLLMIAISPFFFVGLAMLYSHHIQSMPDHVTLAGGLDQGMYNQISTRIASRLRESQGIAVEVVGTGGSMDNRQRLLNRAVHLAPMQASAINDDRLCVVAPLFYELAHLLVRGADFDRNSIHIAPEQLLGREIAIGPPESGSQGTAKMILESLEISPDVSPRIAIGWSELNSERAPNIALICVGSGSKLIVDLLADGWQLKSIPQSIMISIHHPTLRPMTIDSSVYPGSPIPTTGLPTIGTTAFLASRRDAPAELVQATLELLYQKPLLFADLIPRFRAAEWQGWDFHPTARQYFATSANDRK